ncbi:hypothetical protein LINGRAHAP2_LOCUS20916 [Linum grandiflorum]
MSQATEFKVRVLASMRLGMDLSDIEHKKFVRQVLESYLLSSAEQIDDANEGETATKKEAEVDDNGNRFVCKVIDCYLISNFVPLFCTVESVLMETAFFV